MADIVGSLFGISSQELMNQQRLNDQNFATNVANIYQNPNARLGALIGASLGGGLARGLFNIQDPQIKAAQDFEMALAEAQQTSSNPAEAMMKLADKLGSDPRFSRQAAMARMKAQELEQATSLNQAKIANEEAQSNKFKAEALKALRQDDPVQKLFFELAKNASPKSVAAAIQAGGDIALLDSPETKKFSPLAQQLIDAGYVYGSPQFNAKMLEFLEAEKAGKSKGSGNVYVSPAGQTPAIDISRLDNSFKEFVLPNKEKLGSINEALKLAEQALTNPQAGVQLNALLASLYQGGRLSNQDINRTANPGSLPAQVLNNFNKIISGTDTETNIADKVKLLKSLQEGTANSLNSSVDAWAERWQTAPGVSKETIDTYTKGAKFRKKEANKPKTAEEYLKGL